MKYIGTLTEEVSDMSIKESSANRTQAKTNFFGKGVLCKLIPQSARALSKVFLGSVNSLPDCPKSLTINFPAAGNSP